MTATTTRTVRLSRAFDAPPERVFGAWLDPAKARRWLFATPAGEIVRCEIDPRPGGVFTIVDRRSGEDVAHIGVYDEVDPPRRLAFTFSVPKYSATSTRVTIDIAARPGGCDLALTQEGVPAEYLEQTTSGWRTLLDACATKV
jgi:uncharacterized protein YndB with AHSA1/START domain